MVSMASEDFPEPESPVKTTSLSRGIDRVTFLRLCSRAPRIVIWSVGIRTFGYSFSRVIANVALAVATRRPSRPSTLQSVTAVRRPAWTTWPVARRVSPTFAAEMKVSFKSKLMARDTPGLRVRRLRPMAESASALIMPPWTKPAWLAISSVEVISTTAWPSSRATSWMPSQSQAREWPRVLLLTPLAFGHRHAGRRGSRHEPVLLVEHVRLAEEKGLAHLDHPADGPQPAFDRRADEVDLQLDRGVPHAVFLERCQGHSHGGVRELGDHASLDHPAAVAVLGPGDQLHHHTAGLGLGDPGAEGLHPPRGLRFEQSLGAAKV